MEDAVVLAGKHSVNDVSIDILEPLETKADAEAVRLPGRQFHRVPKQSKAFLASIAFHQKKLSALLAFDESIGWRQRGIRGGDRPADRQLPDLSLDKRAVGNQVVRLARLGGARKQARRRSATLMPIGFRIVATPFENEVAKEFSWVFARTVIVTSQ